MKYLFFLTLSIYLVLCGLETVAQESIFPLRGNPVLKGVASTKQGEVLRTTSIDTLLMPFIDDFSREGVYPQADRWMDSGAFINTSFPVNPITIGVATLDGLDQFGNPYNINSGTSVPADYLTSLPIDLSANVNDTSIWLSFFYQPQGLGDAPEAGDSLVVEFRDTSGNWIHRWSVPGREDTVFQRVNLRVNNRVFLYRGFQFRFYNYATVNGNRDHWNLDYVILRTNTVANDSIRDNGFIRPRYSLLNEYQAMPYSHYKALGAPAAAITASITDSIRDINYGPTSFIYTSTIKDEFGNSLYASAPSSLPGASNSITAFNTSLNNFSYPITSADRAEFEMKNYVTITGAQSNLFNDTVKYRQVFDNFYAYDDGTAELGYGVTGNSGVKMAYKFDVKKADTLRAVDIYFNPTGVNVSTSLFQLAVWENVDPSGNTENLLYREINQRPQNIDSLNGFSRYTLDTLIVLQPGPVWVGFIQNSASLLIGLGLDRNTDNHQNMFYHVDGYWYASSIEGSWMMRPVFGDTLAGPISVQELTKNNSLLFDSYPQPANDLVRIVVNGPVVSEMLRFRILDISGKTLSEGTVTDFIDVKALPAGCYFLQLTDERRALQGTRKLMIHR